ncbi:MAG TPA: mechanosensitive ion channel [Candidatus Caccomonas pullistercoris]|nr:mechanosensitive ion channel [Candidatus Caccomonas pullistercoris]
MLFLLNAAKTASDALSVDALKIEKLIDKLIDLSITAGKHILMAVVIFVVGRFIVTLLNRLLARMLERRKVDPTIQTFLKSLVNILLMLLLVVSVIGALGVNTTSFAALLASAGVAIGMALSGQLQNLAGGLIVLLFRPYKVGDWIEAQGVQGKVTAIQIFHTILTMVDNKVVYVPNGVMSSGVVVNYNRNDTRRVEWVVGIDYGEDTVRAEAVVREVIAADKRILADPAPYVAVQALDASSVNLVARVWVKTPDYWDVSYDTNRRIYDAFNRAGINFPFPQQTIHVVKD